MPISHQSISACSPFSLVSSNRQPSPLVNQISLNPSASGISFSMAGTLLNRMSKWFGFHNHFPFSLDLLFPSRDKQSTPSLATRYYRPCPIGPSAAQEVFWTLDLVELILLGAYGPHDGSTLSGAQLRQLCALQHLNRASYFCINLCYKLRRLMWLDWPSIAQEPTLRDLTWNPLLEISGAGVFRGVDYQRLGGYTRKPGLWASMQISRPKCSMIYITGPVWEGGVKYIQDEYRFNPGGITLGQLCEFPSIQQEWSLHVGQVPWVNVYFEEAARSRKSQATGNIF